MLRISMTAAEVLALSVSAGSRWARGWGWPCVRMRISSGPGGELKLRHILAVERFAVDLAVERGDPMLAPIAVRARALDLAHLIRGD